MRCWWARYYSSNLQMRKVSLFVKVLPALIDIVLFIKFCRTLGPLSSPLLCADKKDKLSRDNVFMWQTFLIRLSFLIIFPVVFFMKIYYFILQIKKIKYEMKWNFFIGFDATECYLTAGSVHCFRLKLPDVGKTLLSWWSPGYSNPVGQDNDEGWGRLSWFFLSILSLQVKPES